MLVASACPRCSSMRAWSLWGGVHAPCLAWAKLPQMNGMNLVREFVVRQSYFCLVASDSRGMETDVLSVPATEISWMRVGMSSLSTCIHALQVQSDPVKPGLWPPQVVFGYDFQLKWDHWPLGMEKFVPTGVKPNVWLLRCLKLMLRERWVGWDGAYWRSFALRDK